MTFARTPVLLTHDIDSPEGLRNLHRMFLPLEEAVGARSANYIVPCAWPVDDAVVQDLLARDKTFTPAERQLPVLLEKLARR